MAVRVVPVADIVLVFSFIVHIPALYKGTTTTVASLDQVAFLASYL